MSGNLVISFGSASIKIKNSDDMFNEIRGKFLDMLTEEEMSGVKLTLNPEFEDGLSLNINADEEILEKVKAHFGV